MEPSGSNTNIIAIQHAADENIISNDPRYGNRKNIVINVNAAINGNPHNHGPSNECPCVAKNLSVGVDTVVRCERRSFALISFSCARYAVYTSTINTVASASCVAVSVSTPNILVTTFIMVGRHEVDNKKQVV